MKKVFAIFLALTLVFSLSVTAFAAGTGDYTQNVTGSYNAGTAADTVYSVDISWEELSFTYTAPAVGSWNPDTLSYDGAATQGTWSGTGTITVKNRSNVAITATPSYAQASGYDSASVTFSSNSLNVASADTGVATGTEQSGTITVTPTGSLPKNTSNATIGTITLTIS